MIRYILFSAITAFWAKIWHPGGGGGFVYIMEQPCTTCTTRLHATIDIVLLIVIVSYRMDNEFRLIRGSDYHLGKFTE